MPLFDSGGFMQSISDIEQKTLFLQSYKDDSSILHFHSQIELYFVDEGEIEITVGDESSVVREGEMSVALGYIPHAYKSVTPSASSVLLISPDIVEDFISDTKGKRLVTPFIKDKTLVAEIRRLYNRLFDDNMSETTRRGVIYMILGTIIDRVGLVGMTEPLDTDLGMRILRYVDENYSSCITPQSVSSYLGYNQSYISRYFRATFGTTLSRYITSVKLRAAVLMMLDGRMGIVDVAAKSGFSSMRTFYRSFAEEYGVSPTEYVLAYKRREQ